MTHLSRQCKIENVFSIAIDFQTWLSHKQYMIKWQELNYKFAFSECNAQKHGVLFCEHMWCTGDTCPYLSSFNFFTSLHHKVIQSTTNAFPIRILAGKNKNAIQMEQAGLPNFEYLQLNALSTRYDKCTRICRSIFILVRPLVRHAATSTNSNFPATPFK